MAAATSSPLTASVSNNGAESTTVKDVHTFEVTCPLPLTKGGGKLNLPTQLTPINRRRRVSIEIHEIALAQSVAQANAKDTAIAADGDSSNNVSEIAYVRIMERHKKINPAAVVKENILNPLTQMLLPDTKKDISKETVNFFTGARRKDDEGDDDDEDEDKEDEDSVLQSFKDQSSAINEDEGWQNKYKIPLKMFHVVNHHKKSNAVVVSFKFKNRSTQREFIFDTDTQATEFRRIVQVNQNLMVTRAKARLDNALQGIQLVKGEQLTFLIDICSGMDLPSCDIGKQSDPFVNVYFEGKKIHQTSFVSNTANPIWTLRKGSLFIFKIDAVEFFESHQGLTFEVKDYDAVGDDESLGGFSVKARTLYKWADNERKLFAVSQIYSSYFDQFITCLLQTLNNITLFVPVKATTRGERLEAGG